MKSLISNNPFNSEAFVRIWSEHFIPGKSIHVWNDLRPLKFYKTILPNLYINLGRNNTKGIFYQISSKITNALKYNTLMIYDVPSYHNIKHNYLNSSLKIKKVRQYDGYFIDLLKFSSVEDYMLKTFSKNGRMKLRKYVSRFEKCFNPSYDLLRGYLIDKEAYDQIFEDFKKLLEKRFQEKSISNNNLNKKEWDFIKESTHKLIETGEASLFIISINKKAVSMTLNYHIDVNLIDAITVFDTDYSKFHLGSVNILKLIEWSMKNDITRLDFSKGFFDYKERWATDKYHFDYHFIYDKNSIIGSLTANLMVNIYRLKQYLREKNINIILHKLTYRLKNKTINNNRLNFTMNDAVIIPSASTLTEIHPETTSSDYIKPAFFEFLYLFPVSQNELRIFQDPLKKEELYFVTEKISKKIIFNH